MARNPNSSYAPIAQAISEIRAQQRYLQEKMKALRAVKALVKPHIRPLMAAHKAGLLRWHPNVSTTGDKERFVVEIYGFAQDLDGFKDKRLLRVLSKYLDADSSRTQDQAESLTREFRFEYRPSMFVQIIVRISAQVKSDNPTCQKVLKSTKTEVVERREYEIVCNG